MEAMFSASTMHFYLFIFSKTGLTLDQITVTLSFYAYDLVIMLSSASLLITL
jgi:hypothetical protein